MLPPRLPYSDGAVYPHAEQKEREDYTRTFSPLTSFLLLLPLPRAETPLCPKIQRALADILTRQPKGSFFLQTHATVLFFLSKTSPRGRRGVPPSAVCFATRHGFAKMVDKRHWLLVVTSTLIPRKFPGRSGGYRDIQYTSTRTYVPRLFRF